MLFQVRIGTSIAHYHAGATGESAAKALRQPGHETDILSSGEFFWTFPVRSLTGNA